MPSAGKCGWMWLGAEEPGKREWSWGGGCPTSLLSLALVYQLHHSSHPKMQPRASPNSCSVSRFDRSYISRGWPGNEPLTSLPSTCCLGEPCDFSHGAHEHIHLPSFQTVPRGGHTGLSLAKLSDMHHQEDCLEEKNWTSSRLKTSVSQKTLLKG